MAYTDKFIDRTPCLKAAGLTKHKKNENVENCLTFPFLDTLPTEFKTKPRYDAYLLPKLRTDPFEGVNTKMRQLINPPLQNMYQRLQQELKLTVYDSYWDKVLGKTKDASRNLPASIDTATTSFGKKTNYVDTVKELVNPSKTAGEVLVEADIAHDLYTKTHNNYYPGEQRNRKYDNPPLNKNLIWGETITSDPEGGCTKKVLKWYNQNNLTAVNEILARHKFYSQPQVGKVYAPNENIKCVPKHHTFGKILEKNLYGAGDLMRDCAPSQDKINLSEELAHINLLRTAIRKRAPPFPHRDLLQDLTFEDKENTGHITLSTLYDICDAYGIHADKPKLEALLLRLGTLSEESKVNYKDFAAVIDVNSIFPPLDKLNDIPPEIMHYETTYRALTNDLKLKKEKHFEVLPIAGAPSWNLNSSHRDSLDSEISMETLISPNIFTQYGLSHRDFFKPRTREYISKLFEKIGVVLPADMFNKLCDIGEEQDGTGGICVETFRNLLDRLTTKYFN